MPKSITREAESELIARWKSGDRKAGAELLKAHAGFLHLQVRRYRSSNLDFEDMLQVASIGLLTAATKFDANAACALVTYAAHWIRHELQQYSYGQRFIRIVRANQDGQAVALFLKSNGKASAHEMAKRYRMSLDKAEAIIAALEQRPVASTDAHDVPDTGEAADELLGEQQRLEALRVVVASVRRGLPPREQRLMDRIMSDGNISLRELGDEFSCCRERMRQLDMKLRRTLKERLREALDAT